VRMPFQASRNHYIHGRSLRKTGPKRAQRKNNMSGRRGRDFDSGPREMHKAVCADCKQECEVPFKPDGSRPVYCRDCFQKHRPKRDRF